MHPWGQKFWIIPYRAPTSYSPSVYPRARAINNVAENNAKLSLQCRLEFSLKTLREQLLVMVASSIWSMIL